MARGIKTGGRKKGVPNKATAKKAAAIAATGITPLDYLLKVMRNPKADAQRRDEAAKAAAPYVHPKLSAVEMSGPGGVPLSPPVINIGFANGAPGQPSPGTQDS
jgi:hypothetical protein